MLLLIRHVGTKEATLRKQNRALSALCDGLGRLAVISQANATRKPFREIPILRKRIRAPFSSNSSREPEQTIEIVAHCPVTNFIARFGIRVIGKQPIRISREFPKLQVDSESRILIKSPRGNEPNEPTGKCSSTSVVELE